MLKSPEQYQPSPEEIKKADEMMTEKQRVESETREEFYKKREEAGIDQNFNVINEPNEHKRIMKGIIKSHNVEIKETYSDTKKGDVYYRDSLAFEGTIDGHNLSQEEAKKIFEKYREFGERFGLDREEEVAEDRYQRTLSQGKKDAVEDLLREI